MDGPKDVEVKKQQPKWCREETILLVSEYFRTKNLSYSLKEKSAEMISAILRLRARKLNIHIDQRYRNISGIKMKFGNI